MRASFHFLSVLLFLLSSLTVISSKLLYRRVDAPAAALSWRLSDPAPQDDYHQLIIALHQNNLDVLDDTFWAVSTPSSPRYGHYLTAQQIHDITALPSETTDAIISWLLDSGVERDGIRYAVGTDAIRVNATVSALNRAFKTRLHVWQHAEHGACLAQYGDSHVPDAFAADIDMVTGLSDFLVPVRHFGLRRNISELQSSRLTEAAGGAAASYAFYPSNALYALYSMPDQSGFVPPAAYAPLLSQAVLQFWLYEGGRTFVQQSYSPADLQLYSRLWSASSSSSVLSSGSHGPNNPSNPGTEATLDIDAISSIYPRAGNTVWVTTNSSQSWYGFTLDLQALSSMPTVVSMSYGIYESSFYNNYVYEGIPASQYMAKTNTEFQKIGLRGTTLIASSGDDGANGNNEYCTYNASFPGYLITSFPATSPFVTAVGGTEITATQSSSVLSTAPFCNNFRSSVFSQYGLRPDNGSNSYQCVTAGTEAAVSNYRSGYTSGGGFSRNFAAPAYQSVAVSAFFGSGPRLPGPQFYNASMRGLPDISMYGSNYPAVIASTLSWVAGTSLSAPLCQTAGETQIGGMVSALNNISMAVRGFPLGFLNPLLYNMSQVAPATIRDITSGNNVCPQGLATCPSCQGFYAGAGWDPVTGLGVPVFNEMAAFIAAGQAFYLVDNGQVSIGTLVDYGGAYSLQPSATASLVLLLLCLTVLLL